MELESIVSKITLDLADVLTYAELEMGVLRIADSINEHNTADWLQMLRWIEARGCEQIELHITSPGGGAYFALALYDALRALAKKGIKITAIVEGYAASAASMIILQAADERMAHRHARLHLHEAQRWVFYAVEKISDLQDEAKEMEAIMAMIVAILSERTGHTVEEVDEFIKRREVWMSAEEAKEWNLIDQIL